jgi:large subunit ribosomal protein L25
LKLLATVREATGKAAAKKIRAAGQLPAVFYGPKSESVKLSVSYADLQKIISKASSENIILGLQIGSEKKPRTVILKELQTDPVRDTFIHADFYEVSMDQEITVDVAINLTGTPEGVTRGGILQTIRRDITISCLPDKLVDSIDVDVTRLDIGDAIHIEDLKLPEGISTVMDGHLTVAVVAAPTVEPEPEEEELEEEAAEAAEAEAEAGEETESVPEE